MPDAQNSEWRPVYESALRETDLTRLAVLVALAESAIFLRFQQLGDSRTDQEERQAMQDAADNLLPIKTEKLKFPPIREGKCK
jgi:hypothetical protein